MMKRYYVERLKTSYAYVLSIASLFFCISFISYHPSDASAFVWSNKPLTLMNYAGLPGSYWAALMFYLFGSAAWLFIPLMLYGAYFLYARLLVVDEWERLSSFFMTILLTAGVLSTGNTLSAGGQIGFLVSSLVSTVVRVPLLVHLFFATFLFMNVLIIFRCSYIHLMRHAVAAYQYMVQFCVRYHVVRRTAYAISCVLWYLVVSPLRFISSFVLRLWDGSLFEGTSLMVPSDDNETFDFTILASLSRKRIDSSSNIYQPEEETSLAFNEYQPENEEDDYKEYEHTIPYQPTQRTPYVEKKPPVKAKPKHGAYHEPSVDMFDSVEPDEHDEEAKRELEERARILEEKLERFGIRGKVISIKSGSVVTLYEYEPQIDTKLSKILGLEDDLALALQALSIRIIAPIPGKSVVGFEVANHHQNDVYFSKIVQSDEWRFFPGSLPLILGEDTVGNDVIVDLARMPHLLVAGSTGAGKSVALNAMLISLLCKKTPEELQLILIDPKRLEFAAYADIAHLLFPIVTEPKRAVPILRWVVKEMEERYEKMAAFGARNIADYNQLVTEKLPYIVVVIDELADVMMAVGRDIEDLITRIAQMARAAGIHMIVATQRPSVDVITGLIKVNFPSRISFRVTSKIDSRTILDASGADKLLGRGDMLFLDSSASSLKRVHGAYVSNQEITRVVHHIHNQQDVVYRDLQEELAQTNFQEQQMEEPLYEEVVSFLQEIDDVSISLLQRKFRIGYNRSARIIELLESQGLVMPCESGKMRKVIKE